MTITKAIIEDLLPLYAAGEASEDTRRLVDAFLAGDEELRQRVKNTLQFQLPAAAPPDGLETQALNETRQLIARRSHLLVAAFAISYSSFSFAFSDGQVRFLLFRDWPPVALLLSTFGLACWFLLVHGGRRFRETGLALVKASTPLHWFGGGCLVSLPLTLTAALWIGTWANLITLIVGTTSYWIAANGLRRK